VKRCFLLGSSQGYITRINESQSGKNVERNLEGACRQTDQSKSEAVVRQSTLVEEWEAEEPLLFKLLHSNIELDVRQSPASKDTNMEAEKLYSVKSHYQTTDEDTAD
jgi:hypothetical protein